MDDELRAKTDEMLEILLEQQDHLHELPKLKAVLMEEYRPGIEEQVRTFYAEHGEWPVFKRNPNGIGLTMGTQAEIDQLLPPPPSPPPPSPISEEARRIGREDKELRTALRNAHFSPRRMEGVEIWAKRIGITPEEFVDREIDGRVDGSEGEVFRVFRANHGRYPDHSEINEAAEEWSKG